MPADNTVFSVARISSGFFDYFGGGMALLYSITHEDANKRISPVEIAPDNMSPLSLRDIEAYKSDLCARSYHRNAYAVYPRASYEDGRVVCVDGFLHIVDGKALYIDSALAGTGSEFANKALIDMAANIGFYRHIEAGLGRVALAKPCMHELALGFSIYAEHISRLPRVEISNIRRLSPEFFEAVSDADVLSGRRNVSKAD